jgi:hypothetical protein
MKKHFIFLAVFTPFLLIAQVMPSPEPAQLIKSINIPVSQYNGVASVSVPLYNVNGAGGQVPISLDYNTGGIKVSEIASNAGLGWQLNAGGVITRVMRDQPDEVSVFNNGLDDVSIRSHFKHQQDGEKDIFYFSFPGGGGRFIFKDDIQNVCGSNQILLDSCTANAYYSFYNPIINQLVFGFDDDKYKKCLNKGRPKSSWKCTDGAEVMVQEFATLPHQEVKI